MIHRIRPALWSLAFALPLITDGTAAAKKYSGKHGKSWDVQAALSHHQRHKATVALHEADANLRGARVPPSSRQATRFYVYPPVFKQQGYYSYWMGNMTEAAMRSKRRTEDPSQADVFLLGMDSCCERNWPSYTTYPKDANYNFGEPEACWQSKKDRLHQYLLNDAKYLQMDGQPKREGIKFHGQGIHLAPDCRSWAPIPPKHKTNKQPIAYSAPSFSIGASSYRPGVDISWPAKNLVHFDHPGGEVKCGPTKYLVVFKGTNDYPTRANLAKIDNGKDVRVSLTVAKASCGLDHEVPTPCGTGEFTELLTHTKFGLVVRGDAHYSYRFMEVMSAGAIPVIFSDGWVLPFFEVLDYSKFAVLIKEADYAKTVEILRAIPDDKVCAMRKEALRVYREHMATFDGQLETVMRIFDARTKGTARKLPKGAGW